MQPVIGGFAPTIRNRLEAALPKAPQRLGGAGSPLRVWGENRCGSASGGPWTSPKRFHTEKNNVCLLQCLLKVCVEFVEVVVAGEDDFA